MPESITTPYAKGAEDKNSKRIRREKSGAAFRRHFLLSIHAQTPQRRIRPEMGHVDASRTSTRQHTPLSGLCEKYSTHFQRKRKKCRFEDRGEIYQLHFAQKEQLAPQAGQAQLWLTNKGQRKTWADETILRYVETAVHTWLYGFVMRQKTERGYGGERKTSFYSNKKEMLCATTNAATCTDETNAKKKSTLLRKKS